VADLNRLEAERRVRKACSLIASAYRLSDLRPAETIASVRYAIIEGAEMAAEDVREEVNRVA
jgi:hypothetical protein